MRKAAILDCSSIDKFRLDLIPISIILSSKGVTDKFTGRALKLWWLSDEATRDPVQRQLGAVYGFNDPRAMPQNALFGS